MNARRSSTAFAHKINVSIALCLFAAGLALTSNAQNAQAQSPGPSPAAAKKERSRIDELFMWKASEELKLPPTDEQKFNEILTKLGQRRRDAGERMDEVVKKLGQAKSKSESEKAVNEHRTLLREMQAIQNAELDQLRVLLGVERLARYIVVKSELTEKIRSMLATGPAPSGSPSGGQPATPKIIEAK